MLLAIGIAVVVMHSYTGRMNNRKRNCSCFLLFAVYYVQYPTIVCLLACVHVWLTDWLGSSSKR
jgi:hypothetical protein